MLSRRTAAAGFAALTICLVVIFHIEGDEVQATIKASWNGSPISHEDEMSIIVEAEEAMPPANFRMPPVPEDSVVDDISMVEMDEVMPPVLTSAQPKKAKGKATPKFDSPPADLKTAAAAAAATAAQTKGKTKTNGVKLIQEKLARPIKTPAMQVRKRRKLVLPNEMQVLIISDPELPQSAAGLANKDGSFEDPKKALGMAHFNEHMVFMGTKQHPKPSAFDSFLEANGADASNAATATQITNFGFSVSHDAFPKALAMFANMFSNPLMTDKGLKKEINAVNQEYEMHKDDDGWRQLFVQKKTANPKHPFAKFSIGNLHSLGKVDHKEIDAWFKKHYSSNLMSGLVYTKLPLDEAEALVVKEFGQIKNRHLKVPKYDQPILDPKRKGSAVWQKSKTNQHSILLQWELPKHLGQTVLANTNQRPDRLLGHVLNHQGEKSLFAHLRKLGVAHDVSGSQDDKGLENSIFEIEVSLTPDGFAKGAWKESVGHVFAALAKVKKAGDKAALKKIFDTIQTTDKQGWDWQWRNGDVFSAAQDGAADLAGTLDFASYPYRDVVLQEFNHSKVLDLVDHLHPRDVHVYALSQDYPEGIEKLAEHSEHRYGTQWKEQDLAAAGVLKLWEQKLAQPATFMELPGTNPFLPSPGALKVTPEAQLLPKAKRPVYPQIPKPSVLVDDAAGKAHIWEDNMFGDPYVTGHVEMKTHKELLQNTKEQPQAALTALMTMQLLTLCLNHAVTPKLYDFDEAGLSWTLAGGKGTNLVLSWAGTNTEPKHYQELAAKLAGFLKELKEGRLGSLVDGKTYQMLRTSTVHSLENSKKSGPASMTLTALRHKMRNMAYPIDDQIAVVKKLSLQQVSDFAKDKLFKKVFFEGFFSGQLKKPDVLKAWKQVTSQLSDAATQHIGAGSLVQSKMRQLEAKPSWLHVQGESRGNAALMLLDAGGLDCKEREALDVLFQAVPNRFYNDLRSKQQTGYLVQVTSQVMVSHHNVILFLIQSSKYKPGDLVGRYETFIKGTLDDMEQKKEHSETLPKKKFDMIKAAKLAAYKTPNQNIASVGGLMTTLIQNYNSDFDTMNKKKLIAEEMKHEDVLAVAKKVFGDNKKRVLVAYTTKGDKMDKVPAEYVKVQKPAGKMVGKSQFKCPVKMHGAVAKSAKKGAGGIKSDTTLHVAAPSNTAAGVTAGGQKMVEVKKH